MVDFARLTAEDIARVRFDHPLVDVLARMDVAPPTGWDGVADFMICCPCPDHDDSTPSCVIHPRTDRFNCFGCEAKGDVLELVRQVGHVQSLSKAAEILHSRRPLIPLAGASAPQTARLLDTSERPDVTRTGENRVLAANTEAWRYLTLPQLAKRGREYLRGRGIDVCALEAQAGRPLVGHTPFSDTGLVDHLRRKGFAADEMVDSGWASRRDATIRDQFHRRLMVPVRDGQDRLIGVYGRDVTDRANQKYLNTAETVTFHKRSAVFRPNPHAVLDRHATVVVCEGSLDALAIAAAAAAAGASAHFAAVSPSGTALTVEHARAVLAISDKPPLVCADGDAAGIAASSRWVETFMAQGRETVVTVLPESHDPASWLQQNGPEGLRVFVRKGCLERDDSVKPIPAGGLLAHVAMLTALAATKANVDHFDVLPAVVAKLVEQALQVPEPLAVERFATAAGRALADFGVGTESALALRLVRAAQARSVEAGPQRLPAVERSAWPSFPK